MDLHRTLWHPDFSVVSPEERRAARLGLQWLCSDGRVKKHLSERDFLGALWQLVQPLLDPQAVACALPPSTKTTAKTREYDSGVERALQLALEQDPDDMALDTPQRDWIRGFFQTLPSAVMTRLAVTDGRAPVSTAMTLLGELLELDEASLAVLDFIHHREQSESFRQLLAKSQRAGLQTNLEQLTQVLDQEPRAMRAALAKHAPLRALRLVEYERHHADLEDFLPPSALLREVLEAAPEDRETLLALLIEPAPVGTFGVEAFPHLAAEAARVCTVLSQAAATGAVGVNALFHGQPGTGKTELARAVARASGLTAYQVCTADDDGDGLSREGRLSAYLLAQRLLAQRREVVLIFDEVEDAFASGDNLYALFHGADVTGRQKGWMNRILEENPVPAIWITNRTDGMDPAFLRRFLLPVAFTTPPRSVRRQMVERQLGDRGLSPALLDELAADPALAPAQWGAARRLLDLQPQAAPEATVRAGVAALRTLLQGAPAPVRRSSATRFDSAYLNLAGGITPSALVQALHREGRGTLCFYGPPGTGKTAFAEVLAEALDRELVARQASDLLSPYVGETEQALAQLFRECDPTQTVLLLDEVDSFLSDRRQAQRVWERTQVNELLQQMERYPGLFIAATNLMSGIDTAALRRFDFKLQFRSLSGPQRLALFAREALGDDQAPVPPALARHLEGLEGLTPGDFANVCRQRTLLGETLTPEQFLRRLAAEWRLKGEGARVA